jgi:hypothetical protein
MATEATSGRSSLVVELTVALEAPSWQQPQVTPNSPAEIAQQESMPRTLHSRSGTADTKVFVSSDFRGLDVVLIDPAQVDPAQARKGNHRHTPWLALVPLILLFALIVTAGLHVVDLPQTVVVEAGLSFSGLAVFSAVHTASRGGE